MTEQNYKVTSVSTTSGYHGFLQHCKSTRRDFEVIDARYTSRYGDQPVQTSPFDESGELKEEALTQILKQNLAKKQYDTFQELLNDRDDYKFVKIELGFDEGEILWENPAYNIQSQINDDYEFKKVTLRHEDDWETVQEFLTPFQGDKGVF